MTTKRQVNLPEDLCAAAEQRFGAQFPSVELLLEFVLRELLRDDAEKLDQKEKAILEQRLRDLGYL
ncbi:MAG: hypothetical protein WCC04_10140 [Terriglobales bacterium]